MFTGTDHVGVVYIRFISPESIFSFHTLYLMNITIIIKPLCSLHLFLFCLTLWAVTLGFESSVFRALFLPYIIYAVDNFIQISITLIIFVV